MSKVFIERVKKFLHFLQHDLWRIDLVHDTRLSRFGVETLRVTHLVLKGIKEDNCLLHASALTFSTLMALIPFLVIFISIAQSIGLDSVSDYLIQKTADMPEQIRNFVIDIIHSAKNTNLVAVGGAMGAVFLWVVFKLLSGIEESFNQIWGVHSPRSIADKVRNYLSVLVIVPVLLLVAQAGAATLSKFSGQISWLGPVNAVFFQLVPVLILTVAFILVFMFLPNTRVSFKAAATGGFVSAFLAILFQVSVLYLGSIIFRKFMLYGPLATILIFLFWLHISWTILLFGAELAFAIQHRDTYAEERVAGRASMEAKLWVAYSVMQESVRVFEGAETCLDTTQYARANNIPIRLMNEVVGVLATAGLLGPVAEEQQSCYVLLRAPEHVTAKNIFDLMIADGASPEELGLADDLAADEMFAAIDDSLGETLDPITLRKFMGDEK